MPRRWPGSTTSTTARTRCGSWSRRRRLKPDEVEKAYDFFRQGKFFEPTGKMSRRELRALVAALESLGDLPQGMDVNRLVLPGVTEVTD